MLFLPFLDLHNLEESLLSVLLYPRTVFFLLRDDLHLPEIPWKCPFERLMHSNCTQSALNAYVKSAVSIETWKRALYHESLILNESGFRCFPFQKHFRTQLRLLFCFIPKKSLTATILHAFVMSYLGRSHVTFHFFRLGGQGPTVTPTQTRDPWTSAFWVDHGSWRMEDDSSSVQWFIRVATLYIESTAILDWPILFEPKINFSFENRNLRSPHF